MARKTSRVHGIDLVAAVVAALPLFVSCASFEGREEPAAPQPVAPALQAPEPSASRIDLRIDPVVELYFSVRAEAARLDSAPLPGHEAAVAATRRVQEMLGAWGGWGPLDTVVLATPDLAAVRQGFEELDEPLRRRGRDLSVRADAVAMATELEALLPSFMETTWPRRQHELLAARARLDQTFMPEHRRAPAYMLGSLGVADPRIDLPVFLVTECHPPGASTYFLRGGAPATVLGLAGLEPPGLLEETTLHESTHGFDLATRGGASAFQTLRELLEARGVERSDRRYHDVPHTLMFVQAEETIRRLYDPRHVAYGDATDLYERIGAAAVVERRIWKRYLDGEVDRDQALRQIVDELVPAPPPADRGETSPGGRRPDRARVSSG